VAERSGGMTGKATPLYIVCSPCRCVGKTLISRLLVEFCVVKDRPVAAFDLADEGPQLADYLPKFATVADIGDIRGQMALFDHLIAEKDTPRVIDVSHRAFKNFFTIVRAISFFEEARRRSITPLILFIIDPSAVSIEAYARLRRQFTDACLLPVRNKIDAVRCVVSPNASMLPSSLDVPVLGFSLRALIDRQAFSFSQFWQAIPAGIPHEVDTELRGWLEYIFFQFHQLEFSLKYEDPPTPVTVQGSRQLHTTHRWRPIDVPEQVLTYAPNQVRRIDDPMDQSLMFLNLFNTRKRAALYEFEVAFHYLLHDAQKLVPLLKETYKDKWAGFIDDIQKGTRPYEEATAVIGIFLQHFFADLDREKRNQIIASISQNNLVDPPNLLQIIGQVAYSVYLAEQGDKVREKCCTIWVNDMSNVFAEAGGLSREDCSAYLWSLTKRYRDEKRRGY